MIRFRDHSGRDPAWLRLLFLVCWLCAANSHAQEAIPTLKRQLTRSRTDTARSHLLSRLGERYGLENTDSSLYYLHQSLRLAKYARDSFGQARAMCQLGHACLYLKKDEAAAVRWLTQARLLARRHSDYTHLAKSFQLLAMVALHQHVGNAVELLDTALLYARKADSWAVSAEVHSATSELYVRRQDYAQALSHMAQSMAIYRKHNPSAWFTEALDYCRILNELGQHNRARVVLRELFRLKPAIRPLNGPFVYANDMARLALELKRYSEAETYLLNGLKAERSRATPDTLHLYHYYKTLVNLYTVQRRFEQAYRFSTDLANARLWLQRTRLTRDGQVAMVTLQAALGLEKKEHELAALAARQQRQELYLAGTLLTAGLLVGFVFMLQLARKRIERQRLELTQLNLAKDKLFAVLAHDLRSPMACLSNYLTLTEWGALNQHEFSKALPALNDKLHSLSNMLDNLLNWSLSQMGSLYSRPERVLLRECVSRQLNMLQPMLAAKYIRLDNQVPAAAVLWVDADHLSIIIRNLLQNAVKFTEAGGCVSLRYCAQGKTGQLQVIDTGVGIPPAEISGLFRLKGHSPKRGTSNEAGTGLGLVLVHELVQANRGTITVTSRLNEGTTFSITFPAAPMPNTLKSKATLRFIHRGCLMRGLFGYTNGGKHDVDLLAKRR